MMPVELKNFLAARGIEPLRDRSQNFLLDEKVADAVVAAAGAAPGRNILEIGPGQGFLTAKLLAAGAEVAAVEIDRKLCALLRRRFGSSLRLIEGDILSWTNSRLLAEFGAGPAGEYAVAANLPYAITSPILEKFLFEEPKPTSLTVMVQREVADRILAGPGGMSSLAVMIQSLARPRRVVDVPRTAFWPAPRVDSTVIHMDLKNSAELRDFFGGLPPARFFETVRTAFAGKRKQLKNTLRSLGLSQEKLINCLVEAKIDPRQRPEELSPQVWAELARVIFR